MSELAKFETWAIVEFMGHVRVSGYVQEELVFGVPMIRVDIPPKVEGEPGFTRYWHPNVLYSLSPVGEDIARAVAKNCNAEPVSVYEFPQPQLQAVADRSEIVPIGEDDDGYDEDDTADHSGLPF